MNGEKTQQKVPGESNFPNSTGGPQGDLRSAEKAPDEKSWPDSWPGPGLGPLLVLAGPTAVGKTDLSIAVAEALDGEIINADSTLVYRYMDIGTAKPSLAERRGVPHHLIDIISPDEPFSVAEFVQLVRQTIAAVHGRRRLPILVGGTGLYLKAVVEGYAFPTARGNPALREKLRRIAETEGKEALHRRLAAVDPQKAARLHPNDVKRVIRALEIYEELKQPMSQMEKKEVAPYDVLFLVLTRPRPILYERINRRVLEQIRQGLVEEVAGLLARGYSPKLFSLQTLGYKEIIAYLKGLSTLEEAIRLIQRNTRHLAKRQLTWFRGQVGITWLELGDNREDDVARIARKVVERWPFFGEAFFRKRVGNEAFLW